MCGRCCSPAGACAIRTPGQQLAIRPGQLDLGHARLRWLRRHGRRREAQFSPGVLSLPPDGSKLEFIRSTNNNTWGLGFSEEGLVFGSTANRNPSVYMPIANRYYEAVRGWSSSVLGGIADTQLFHAPTEKIRQVDHHGGYTAARRACLVHGPHVSAAILEPHGFRRRTDRSPDRHVPARAPRERFPLDQSFNLLASDDEWVAPIMAEVGPDGNVWVIDWYNYIVQHNPDSGWLHDTGKGSAYETELRDKRHGRIYRVVYREAPKLISRSNLQVHRPTSSCKRSSTRTCSGVNMPSGCWLSGARPISSRRYAVMANDKTVDAIGLNTSAIHALWTLHGLGALNGRIQWQWRRPTNGFESPSAGVRRNAAAVLPSATESVQAILAARLFERLGRQVRLAALLSLAEMPPRCRPAWRLCGNLYTGERRRSLDSGC